MCGLKKASRMQMCRKTFAHDYSLMTSVELPYQECRKNHHIEQVHSSSKIKMCHRFESKGSYSRKLKIGVGVSIARSLKLHQKMFKV